MNNKFKPVLFIGLSVLLMSFVYKKRVVKVYLAGNSTAADYSLEKDFQTRRYPITGWGQVFQQFESMKGLNLVK